MLAKYVGYDKFQKPDPIYYKWENELVENRFSRKLILKPRTTFKSTFYSAIGCAWRILNNQNIRIILLGRTVGDSTQIVTEIKNILINPKIERLFERMFITDNRIRDKDNLSRFNVVRDIKQLGRARGYTVLAIGERSSFTGKHCDLLILDDYCNEQDSSSKPVREHRIEKYRSIQKVPIDLPEHPGEILVIGTRKHIFDLYNTIIDSNKQSKIWYISTETPYYDDGDLRYPTWLPQSIIDYNRIEMGSHAFSHEMMNEPQDESELIFRKQYMRFYDRAELVLQLNDEKFRNCYMVYSYLDLAISTKQSADYNALITAAFQLSDIGLGKRGDIFVLDAARIKDLPSGVYQKVYGRLETYIKNELNKFNSLTIEDNSFQIMWVKQYKDWLKANYPNIRINIKTKTNVKDKRARILSTQPDYESGRLQFPLETSWTSEQRAFFEEILCYPGSNHDDCPDALAGLHNAIGRRDKILSFG